MLAKSATLKDLQRQCKAEGLDATGTKADLVKRLGYRRNREVLSPESQDDMECEAILITGLEFGGEAEMKKGAKDALEQALQEEEFHVEDVGGKHFVGNRRGLDLAGLTKRVRVLEQQVAGIPSLKIRIDSLEDRVLSLTTSLDVYKLLRSRFISTFKRDKLARATEADRKIIAEGNSWAHGGDAVVDALLYAGTGGRRDFKAFEKLYGFPPETVQRIRHNETIDILNTHAGVIASKHKAGSDKFYKLFAEFVEAFKESGEGYEEGYLEGDPTDVTRAYWAFVNCVKDEVTRVDTVEVSV